MNSVLPSLVKESLGARSIVGTPLVSFGQPVERAIDTLRQRAVSALMSELSNAIVNGTDVTGETIDVAAEETIKLYEVAEKLGGWSTPHITATTQGEIVLEWWRNARKLTIYLHEDGCEFIKVWGPDIETEMESGQLDHWSFISAWRWLNE